MRGDERRGDDERREDERGEDERRGTYIHTRVLNTSLSVCLY
jgi:hypothetical protein